MIAIDETAAWTLGLITFFLFLALYVWTALALGAVFRKSGEAAWKGWVPFLNQATLFQLGGLSGWLVLLWFLPVVGALIVWVAQIVACNRINQEFGFGAGMTVLAALLLPVWATVVGFGSARWVGRETGAGPLRARAADDDLEADDAASSPAATPAPYSPIAPPPAYGPAYSRAAAAPGATPAAASGMTAAVTGVPSGADTSTPQAGASPARTWAPPAAAEQRASAAVPPITTAPIASAPAAQAPSAPEVSPRYVAPAGVPAPAESAPAAPTVSPAPVEPPVSEAPAPPAVFPPHSEPEDEASGADKPAVDDSELDAEPAGPRRSRSWSGGYDQEDPEWEVTNVVDGAPAPVSAIPPAPSPSEMPPVGVPRSRSEASHDEQPADEAPPAEAQRPAVTRVPAAPAPDRSREPWGPGFGDSEAFPETSGPVSAVVGAPVAGGPRSARTSVSSFHTRPEIPDESIDETIIARRRRTHWSLVLPSGEPVAIGSETVLLGRRPVADPAHPGAQLVAVDDGTVSKTHARLDLRDDRWYITDLGSTNGVVFTTLTGTDVEVPTGVEIEAGDLFILGDAEVRLVRSDG